MLVTRPCRSLSPQDLAAAVARSCLAMPASSAGAGAGACDVDVAQLGAAPLASGEENAPAVADALALAMTQLGENIVVRRACVLPAPEEGVVASYVHNAYSAGVGRTAAAVSLVSAAADRDALRSLGEQLAMHIVASPPLAVSRDEVPAERIAREREILLAQAEESGKPADVVEKMVEGRLNKYFKEVALLEQAFVVDEKGAPVKKALEAAGKRLGAPVECTGFVRFAGGEGA